jgi:uncharacterized protein (TIGR03437 family)
LLVCGASSLCAQSISFLAHRDIPIGVGCCAVVSGDFNGDGKLDLIVGYGTGNLSLLLGDGAGSFKPRIELTSFNEPIQNIAVADVNRDGKLDLLAGTYVDATATSRTYVLLGKGDGTFQSASLLTSSGIPLFVADLNGDGIPDLGLRGLFGLGNCGDMEVRLGNGDGTFQGPLCLLGPEHMGTQAVIGDFNGDGIPDLVWGSGRSNGDVWVFLGNGDGTFRRAPGPGGLAGNRKLAVGDLNHDGKLDVVGGGGNSVAVFLGKGDGTFQEGIYIPAYFGASTPGHDLFIADLNGDGKLDIATYAFVILGNGDGTFQPPQYLFAGSPGASPQVCADLNGDRLPDLVYVDYDQLSQTATGLSVLLNNTPGLPSSVQGYSAASGVGRVAPSSIASVYGKNMAHTTALPSGPTLPTQLGGISLRVRDVTDTVRLAPLFYVSPTQINFLVPDQSAIGPVSLTLDDGSPLVETANATPVTVIAPAIFTVNGQGQGPAAATAVRIMADGTQQPVTVLSCAGPGQCTTVPIVLAAGQPVYLSLYGTGIRGDLFPQGILCTVGGVNAVVQFAGAQPTIPGLDQINILLPATLASGIASVQCQFNFQINAISNPVQIEIK